MDVYDFFWLAISVGDCWMNWLAFNTSLIALTKLYEETFLEFESTGVIKCENRVWTGEIRVAINTCLGGKNARH